MRVINIPTPVLDFSRKRAFKNPCHPLLPAEVFVPTAELEATTKGLIVASRVGSLATLDPDLQDNLWDSVMGMELAQARYYNGVVFRGNSHKLLGFMLNVSSLSQSPPIDNHYMRRAEFERYSLGQTPAEHLGALYYPLSPNSSLEFPIPLDASVFMYSRDEVLDGLRELSPSPVYL